MRRFPVDEGTEDREPELSGLDSLRRLRRFPVDEGTEDRSTVTKPRTSRLRRFPVDEGTEGVVVRHVGGAPVVEEIPR